MDGAGERMMRGSLRPAPPRQTDGRLFPDVLPTSPLSARGLQACMLHATPDSERQREGSLALLPEAVPVRAHAYADEAGPCAALAPVAPASLPSSKALGGGVPVPRKRWCVVNLSSCSRKVEVDER